jgi:hypothetical protein
MRDLWWNTAFDLESTVERFVGDPDAIEFCPTFHIEERFEHRSPRSMPMDMAFLYSNTLEDIEDAFKLRAGELTSLNPSVARNRALKAPVRLPDPGFITWLAARFAGRAAADRTLSSSQRVTMIRSLVPLAAANPTALDTVLSRLVLAQQPTKLEALDRIASLANVAIVQPGGMAAALPDANIPA